MSASAIEPDVTGAVRRRTLASLLPGVALMNVAMVGASTIGTLVASELAGRQWSGIPSAAGVLGTAAGALGLGSLMARRGHRMGMTLGYAIAAIGGVVAVLAVLSASLLLLILGMSLLGLGNGGAQLARYAAAETFPPERKGFALSVVVWGGTVGALAGPALIAPAADLALSIDLPRFSGSYLLAMVAPAAGCLISLALPRGHQAIGAVGVRGGFVAALRMPTVSVALTAMVTAQLAMVGVMTMTPLHIHDLGRGLDSVGWVLGAHMIGMFALSPLSGRLADRLGGVSTIILGVGILLAAAVVGFSAPAAHTSGLPVSLFLLGYGWNLAFVGGSALLSRDLPAERRTALQGAIDAMVWSSSAVASLGAGAVFAWVGYQWLTVVAAMVSLSPLVVLLVVRKNLSSTDPA